MLKMTVAQPDESQYKLHLGNTRVTMPVGNGAHPVSPSQPLRSTKHAQVVLDAGASGDDTRDYFAHVEGLQSLYADIGRLVDGKNAENMWTKGSDKNNHDVYFIKKKDRDGNTYHATVRFDNLAVNEEGDVMPDGRTITINGTKYQGVGYVTHTVGYNNVTFNQTARWAAVAIGGAAVSPLVCIPMRAIGEWICKAVCDCARMIARSFSRLLSGLRAGALAEGSVAYRALSNSVAEGAETELAESGSVEIITGGAATAETTAAGTAGAGAVGGAAEGGLLTTIGVTLTSPFFLGCIGIAAVCFAVYLTLHNAFHHVRIFNLTKYTMEWRYHIDAIVPLIHFNEGQITEGPGAEKGGKFVPAPISGAIRDASDVPGVVSSPPEVCFADLYLASSHEFTGIGYALQLVLRDPATSKTERTLTVYFDIPFAGDNSTDLTFKKVSDLGRWYDDNHGNNKSKTARARTDDGRFEAKSTFDYLSGKHAMRARFGDSSNECYYYQSVLYVVDNELKVKDLPQPQN